MERGVVVPGVTAVVRCWVEGVTWLLLDAAGLRAGAARAAEEDALLLKDAAAERGVLTKSPSSDESLLESQSSLT